jgi:hypothetical protein
MAATVDGAMDEPGSLENLHVLGRSGERHGKRLGEFADGEFAQGEPAQHLAARIMGQRVKDIVHQDPILNHMVEDRRAEPNRQPVG